jgi:DNA-binding NtrC family response regulator
VHGARVVNERVAIPGAWERRAWIVEDEPAAATLAAELCEANGAIASVFRLPLPFITALRSSPGPAVVVLDWRLEHQLSAALFLATRHRYPRTPIIYWTGSAAESLPAMIQDDRYTVIVDKASGTTRFEEALAWALDEEQGPAPAD